MRCLFSLLFILTITIRAVSQDTLRVLFIGNSFMSANNLPALFQSLCQGSGVQAVVASRIPGGCSVGDTIQGTFAHMYNPTVYALIKGAPWDFLFIQDRQSRFAMSYGTFPGDSRVIEGHIKIRDSLLFYNPCARMIWFAGFGLKNGMPPLANTGAAMIDSIYQNYLYLKDTAGQVIAPIGPAYLRIMDNYPSIDLWAPDEEHPSLAGSSLIAEVLYATAFKRRPLSSSFNPGLPAIVDSVLKITAYQTVIDSLHFTGLQEITPEMQQGGNTLWVTGYSGCTWYLNNVLLYSGGCSCAITQTGWYRAVVTDNSGCTFRTIEKYVEAPSAGAEHNPGPNGFAVTCDQTSGTIILHSPVRLKLVRMINSTGEILMTFTPASLPFSIPFSGRPGGLYLISAYTETGEIVTRKVMAGN